MLADKMVFISGIIIYFISSTNCEYLGEKTKIATLVDDMKGFLEYVEKLDVQLQLPKSYHEFSEVKTHYFWETVVVQYESIWVVQPFRREYKKFVKISIECIENYLKQIDNIAKGYGGRISYQQQRTDFVKWVDGGFTIQMSLKGEKDSKVEKKHKQLQDELIKLRNRINIMVDPYSPPSPVLVLEKNHKKKGKSHKHGHSSASSESGSKQDDEAELGFAAGFVAGAAIENAAQQGTESSEPADGYDDNDFEDEWDDNSQY